ncbi:MAG: hypothetical protein COW32_10255 [Candidatus Aquicultor secundus]|uniref:Uncharacterized protein n=1 Tax=Candidatus Aquicultor secundus TaxID=1973895 RepID=A0A2M7T8P4_9ACTN|nr:hypothetical protein [Candidatus Aquicultor secundus]NCO65144.1 hypothetical protein [Solirubrobacter sp.]OIO87017.1 MAG: hypothetical protein AUK32_04585 [Candidatus Aquicultor secundus]PIU28088.1 MAG: hypothetical protein COT10_00030 [Candidatus Aquicultor secundus]PIW21370.1 MAG: hypothetical protein COW32_10255 [Candidatus Aquicultor secundus]PIX52788.1 MAG: hypothetical protein COZ51_02215 [Candidatus Aquicultor secundus]
MTNIVIVTESIDSDGVEYGPIKGVPKSEDPIEKAVAVAEARGADFTGITIKSSDYHDGSSYGFILVGRPNIYLQGVDLAADCAWYCDKMRSLYEKLSVHEPLPAELRRRYKRLSADEALADRLNDVVESIVRTLLHEYCHLKTLDATGII